MSNKSSLQEYQNKVATSEMPNHQPFLEYQIVPATNVFDIRRIKEANVKHSQTTFSEHAGHHP